VFSLCLLVLFSVSCGYKTSPRPATATVPTEIGLLDASAYPDKVVLTWDVPKTNTDGSKITDISGFKVYRSEQKKDEACENCPQDRQIYANIDFQNPVDAKIDNNQVTYTDRNVVPGHVYTYNVNVYNLRGRESKAAADISIPLQEVPPSPTGFQGNRTESGAVQLEWDLVNDETVQGFRIYRSELPGPDTFKLLTGRKGAENSYVDESADKNKEYYYMIRSFRMVRGIAIESEPSPSILIKPGVIPPKPKNLSGISTRNGIELKWDEVTFAGSTARYNIFRSETDSVYTKVNSDPIAANNFIDKNARRGKKYKYVVTVFNADDPQNESTRSLPIEIQFKR